MNPVPLTNTVLLTFLNPKVDDLLDHIEMLKSLRTKLDIAEDTGSIRPTHLTVDGIFGRFLRRLTIAFDTMMFVTVSRLFDQVQTYRRNEEARLVQKDGQVS